MPRIVQSTTGGEFSSAICKQSVEEAFLSVDGFQGDGIADTKHHGGPDRAVCVYPSEHYTFWEKKFSCTLPSSTFGENLTVDGMLEKDICIGDVFAVGDAVIQVTQGRVPCSTISKRTGLPDLMKGMVNTGFTGYLCRVVEEGIVRLDSTITSLQQDPNQVSILYANEVYFQRPKDVEGLKRILGVDALAEEWRDMLMKRLEKLGNI
ncbi:MOSC domain-containing protein [Sporosarcina sp. P2]|uniref:MOSC domain-containing protein n=1 Tax=Sporosarcina sp. P2 TaxID=2048251 RepID=UPI000C16CE68|nr:MOSC domain-containing protein [Sporosarcina sp. P2]PID03437.1 MOSC domain-containing protein [Sporosarcina sp. P2]